MAAHRIMNIMLSIACAVHGQVVQTSQVQAQPYATAHTSRQLKTVEADFISPTSIKVKHIMSQSDLKNKPTCFGAFVRLLLELDHANAFKSSGPAPYKRQNRRSHTGFQVYGETGSLQNMNRRTVLAGAAGAAASGLFPVLPVVAAEQNVYQVPNSVADKRILITGANTGLGLESGKRLAQAGAKVVLTARTQAKADAALSAVKDAAPKAEVHALVLDLGSLESIRKFPAKYNEVVGSPLDILMANAGVMAIPERLTTTDGFERQLGVNHLGHFALVSGMMPVLRKAESGFRIISVSSAAHRFASKDSMKTALASNLDPKDYQQWGNYGLSKAANILFANELQRRFDAAGVRGSAVSLHPGGVATDLGRYLVQGVEAAEAGVPLKETYEAMNPIQKFLAENLQKVVLTVPVGANTQLFLAAAADSNGDLTRDGGKYFEDMKVVKAADFTNSQELASELFQVSERLTGTKIDI